MHQRIWERKNMSVSSFGFSEAANVYNAIKQLVNSVTGLPGISVLFPFPISSDQLAGGVSFPRSPETSSLLPLFAPYFWGDLPFSLYKTLSPSCGVSWSLLSPPSVSDGFSLAIFRGLHLSISPILVLPQYSAQGPLVFLLKTFLGKIHPLQ